MQTRPRLRVLPFGVMPQRRHVGAALYAPWVRRVAVRWHRRGFSPASIAGALGVSVASVCRWSAAAMGRPYRGDVAAWRARPSHRL